MTEKREKNNIIMTEGSIWGRMLAYTVPLFFGRLFQMLYNTADSIIVGNLIGSGALAAVGGSGALINTLIGFVNGTCSGAGIIIAKYFGAGDDRNLRLAIHTTAALGLAAGLVMTAIGMTCTPLILELMGTPEDVMTMAQAYVRTYFSGSLFFVLYNISVGILHAVGDARHPLYYLIFSSIVNIVLDIFFIAVLDLGVMGTALATVIAQFISAMLCIRILIRTDRNYRLEIRKIGFDRKTLSDVLRYGLPSGIQNSIVAFSNLLAQTQINSFGSVVMAGNSVFGKIHNIVFLPVQCFCNALAIFTGQNIGAKKYDRLKKGVHIGIAGAISSAVILGGLASLFAPVFIGLFTSDPAVIEIGVIKAHFIAPLMFIAAYTNTLSSVLRGAGKSMTTMVVLIAWYCIFKVIYLFTILPAYHNIYVLFAVFPITWLFAAITFTIIYRRTDFTKTFGSKMRTMKASQEGR